MHVKGELKGNGLWTAVLHNGANSLATLRYRLKDVAYDAISQPYKSGDIDLTWMRWVNARRNECEVGRIADCA